MEAAAKMWIDGVLVGSPVAKALGLEVAELDIDHVRIRLPYSPEATTLADIVHGGVIATLMDVTAAAASASGITAADGATGGATSHLSVTYLAPARGTDLYATGRVIHRTRSSTQSDLTVHDEAGHLVATGQATNRIFH